MSFASAEAHRAALRAAAQLPRGFRVGVASTHFPSPVGGSPRSIRLCALLANRPVSAFGLVTTRSSVVGAPITVARQRLRECHVISGVIINNRVSNVCAPDGVASAEAVCSAAASQLGLVGGESLIPLSTGVIGWPLPVEEMVSAMPALAEDVEKGQNDGLDAAEAIMTTDQWPKLRRADVAGGGSVLGIAKGAGMVEPNLGTMLSVLLTDAPVSRAQLQRILERAVSAPGSFNSCSVDSDTSTSDAVIAISSGLAHSHLTEGGDSSGDHQHGELMDFGSGGSLSHDDDDTAALEEAITAVCQGLAHDVVRNGEGVTHVMRIRVIGAPDDASARAVGRSIVNSPLLKCAVAADDPNVGRLAAAVGKGAMHLGLDLSMNAIRLSVGEHLVMANGAFDISERTEALMAAHLNHARIARETPEEPAFPMHELCVEITVDLGLDGPGTATVLGADLTHEYVSVNADYRT